MLKLFEKISKLFYSKTKDGTRVTIKILFFKIKYKCKLYEPEQNIIKEQKSRKISNTVLMIEENPFHGEIVPGYLKYLLDFGYNVDVFLNEEIKKDNLLCNIKSDKLNVFYMNQLTMKILLTDKNIVNKYKFLFINSFHLLARDWRGELPVAIDEYFGKLIKPPNGFITAVFHRTDLAKNQEILKKYNATTLAPTITNAPVVNPLYFGEYKVTPKNDETMFLISGDGYRTFETIVNMVESIVQKGYENFKIYVTGRFKHDEISLELAKYIEFLGFLSYQDLYSMVEKCDFILPCLDPDNKEHDWYSKTGTSGSIQLSYGFIKPVIIHSKFAKRNSYNSKNSFIYDTKEEYADKIIQAINMKTDEYEAMQDNLKIVVNSIYEKSKENLKKIIENKGTNFNE